MERSADFILNAEAGKPYKILQLTDMQVIDAAQQRRPDRLSPPEVEKWLTEKAAQNCFDPITRLVREVKPDLILITGDIVYGEFDDSGESLNRFLAFMGALDTPWAPVFGNHDNESKIGVAEQCRRYAAAKNCLFRRGDVTGNSNYTLGIREGDRLVRVLYMADSNGCGNCSDPAVRRSHGFGEDQLEWIRDTAAALKAPGFFCCHIPTADAVDAFVECGYQSAETPENPTPFVIGETVPAHHPEDFGYKNERIVERGCTQRLAPLFRECGIDGAFYGHFHKINTSILYEGIRYTFGTKTGTYDYHTPGKLGGTLITLEADRSRFTVEHLYRD